MIDKYLLNEARVAWNNNDYNYARQCYQQVAYSYNDFTELEQETFTKEVSEFAKDDPVYQQIVELVKEQIRLEKGPILQSKLTNIVKIDYGEAGAELLRYVLYYAAYNDDLIRTKKGRSYLLQLPQKRLETSDSGIAPIPDTNLLENKEEPFSLVNLNTKTDNAMGMIFFDGSKTYQPSILELEQIEIDEYDELQKLATTYKYNNWGLSLACLFKAKKLLYCKGSAPLLQQMTRLPIFLQQAGLFEESKSELQELFDNVEHYVESQIHSMSENQELSRKYYKANYLNHLFDKARLIYKREKLNELSNKFNLIALDYAKEADVYSRELAKCRQERLNKFQKERETLKQERELREIFEQKQNDFLKRVKDDFKKPLTLKEKIIGVFGWFIFSL
ncbi:hypothetical protein [Pasteurella multocida]|uniref:hypothetical protein n=1 Tax=Pasteurella multocida TaxID=747 RepID=UPI00397923F4